MNVACALLIRRRNSTGENFRDAFRTQVEMQFQILCAGASGLPLSGQKIIY